MRYHAAAALLAGIAYATPVPQGFDWDAIDAIEPLTFAETEIPVVDAVAAQTTVALPAATEAAASVSAAVAASPTDTSLKVRGDFQEVSGCTASSSDTDVAFINNANYGSNALNANRPAGYQVAYLNKNGSTQGVLGYMGYSVIESGAYDQLECAKRCDSTKGCQSFNICKSSALPYGWSS